MKTKKQFKDLSLTVKIGIIAAVMIITIFVVFITVTVLMTARAFTQATSAEFETLSKSNAANIQTAFDQASQTAEDIQGYLTAMYQEYDKLPPDSPKILMLETSNVYDAEIESINREIENYIINTMQATVDANEDVVGGGVLFEPYAYDKAIKDYTLYLTDGSSEVTSLGDYENYKNEEYYAKAKETQEPYFTAPYLYDGTMMISAAFPILYQGQMQGIVAVDIGTSNFKRIAVKDDRYSSLYTAIYMPDGTFVFDSRDESGSSIGKNTSEWIKDKDDLDVIMTSFQGSEPFDIVTRNSDSGKQVQRFYYPIVTSDSTWWCLTAIEVDDMNRTTQTIMWTLITMAVVFMALMLVSILIVLYRSLRPLGEINKVANAIAEGDLTREITYSSGDEIGTLAVSFNKTVLRLRDYIDYINEVTQVVNNVADGNLIFTLKYDYFGEFAKVKDALNYLSDSLNNTMQKINQASNEVAGGSNQIAQGAQDLANGAEEQSGAVDELSKTIRAMMNQVADSASEAERASNEAKTSGDQVEGCNEKMQNLVQAMDEIRKTSEAINLINGRIEDIASQTNLLSLNAAIEAARAGDAGKGFAVVAEEVRNLAGESAQAVQDTSDLIARTLAAVQNGTKIADETAEALNKVVEKSHTVVDVVGDLAERASGEAKMLEQVSMSVEQITSVVEGNTATAEQSAASSEELSAQAQVLSDLVSQFELREI